MSDGLGPSQVKLVSAEILKVESRCVQPLETLGWALVFGPTVLCVLCFAAACLYQFWPSAVILGILALAMVGFLISILSLQLQSKSSLTLTPDGVTIKRQSFTGSRLRHIYKQDIAELRAAVQGQDFVRLTADTHSSGAVTLVTVKIDEFHEQATRIAQILTTPYTFTVNCPHSAGVDPLSHEASPDFIRLDPSRGKIVLELLDSPATEVPFGEVASIEVAGPVSDSKYSFGTSGPVFEYIYQPIINFKDGSFQNLQRFRSFEREQTSKSRAFLNATRFTKYLQACVLPERRVANTDTRNPSSALSQMRDNQATGHSSGEKLAL